MRNSVLESEGGNLPFNANVGGWMSITPVLQAISPAAFQVAQRDMVSCPLGDSGRERLGWEFK